MAEQMETILKADRKPEAEAVMQFIDELTESERLEFMGFMRGARFIKGIDHREKEAAQA